MPNPNIEQSELDPTSNLIDAKPKQNRFSLARQNVSKEQLFYDKFVGDKFSDRYDNEDYNAQISSYDQINNLEDYYGHMQGQAAKYAKAIPRLTSRAATSFLETTIAPILGAGEAGIKALATDEGFAEAFANNTATSILEKTQEWFNEEVAPIYFRDEYKDKSAIGQLLSGEGVGTSVADGLGFAVGQFGSLFVPVLGEAGLASKMASVPVKAAISSIPKLTRLAPASAILKGQKAFGAGVNAVTSAAGEAAIESYGAGKEMEDAEKNIIASQLVNMRTQDGVPLYDLNTPEGQAKFDYDLDKQLNSDEVKNKVAKTKMDVFNGNMGLLVATNLVDQALFLKPVKDLFGPIKLTEQSFGEAFKKSIPKTIGESLKEGFVEEGLQTAISGEAIERNLKNQESNSIFNAGEVLDYYADHLGDKEMVQSIFLGGLIGAGMGVAGTKMNHAQEQRLLQGQDEIKPEDIKKWEFWKSPREAKEGLISKSADFASFKNISFSDLIKEDKNENGESIKKRTPEGKFELEPSKLEDLAKSIKGRDDLLKAMQTHAANGHEEAFNDLKSQYMMSSMTSFLNTDGGADLLKEQVGKYYSELEKTNTKKDYAGSKKEINDIIDLGDKLYKNASAEVELYGNIKNKKGDNGLGNSNTEFEFLNDLKHNRFIQSYVVSSGKKTLEKYNSILDGFEKFPVSAKTTIDNAVNEYMAGKQTPKEKDAYTNKIRSAIKDVAGSTADFFEAANEVNKYVEAKTMQSAYKDKVKKGINDLSELYDSKKLQSNYNDYLGHLSYLNDKIQNKQSESKEKKASETIVNKVKNTADEQGTNLKTLLGTQALSQEESDLLMQEAETGVPQKKTIVDDVLSGQVDIDDAIGDMEINNQTESPLYDQLIELKEARTADIKKKNLASVVENKNIPQEESLQNTEDDSISSIQEEARLKSVNFAENSIYVPTVNDKRLSVNAFNVGDSITNSFDKSFAESYGVPTETAEILNKLTSGHKELQFPEVRELVKNLPIMQESKDGKLGYMHTLSYLYTLNEINSNGIPGKLLKNNYDVFEVDGINLLDSLINQIINESNYSKTIDKINTLLVDKYRAKVLDKEGFNVPVITETKDGISSSFGNDFAKLVERRYSFVKGFIDNTNNKTSGKIENKSVKKLNRTSKKTIRNNIPETQEDKPKVQFFVAKKGNKNISKNASLSGEVNEEFNGKLCMQLPNGAYVVLGSTSANEKNKLHALSVVQQYLENRNITWKKAKGAIEDILVTPHPKVSINQAVSDPTYSDTASIRFEADQNGDNRRVIFRVGDKYEYTLYSGVDINGQVRQSQFTNKNGTLLGTQSFDTLASLTPEDIISEALGMMRNNIELGNVDLNKKTEAFKYTSFDENGENVSIPSGQTVYDYILDNFTTTVDGTNKYNNEYLYSKYVEYIISDTIEEKKKEPQPVKENTVSNKITSNAFSVTEESSAPQKQEDKSEIMQSKEALIAEVSALNIPKIKKDFILRKIKSASTEEELITIKQKDICK